MEVLKLAKGAEPNTLLRVSMDKKAQSSQEGSSESKQRAKASMIFGIRGYGSSNKRVTRRKARAKLRWEVDLGQDLKLIRQRRKSVQE